MKVGIFSFVFQDLLLFDKDLVSNLRLAGCCPWNKKTA